MIALIKKHFPLLNDMELLKSIEQAGDLRSIPAGTLLIDIGKYIKTIPLIISGSVKISREGKDGMELFLYYLLRGQTCVMTLNCCTAQKPSEVRALVEEDCQLIAVPVECFDQWFNGFSSWRRFIMQAYYDRFEELLLTVDSIAFMKMDERLENYLAERFAMAESHFIRTTHHAVAADLGTSREVISRLLKQLEKKGKIKLGRNKIWRM